MGGRALCSFPLDEWTFLPINPFMKAREDEDDDADDGHEAIYVPL